jgi:Ser/Thr protein kinase RdoA (MazF antagonist)
MQNLEHLAHIVLKQYFISQPRLTFIRHNENYTCKITDGSTSEEYVMRMHVPVEGFSQITTQHSHSNLYSELKFIKAIGENTNISVQIPVRNKMGLYISEIIDPYSKKTIYTTILTWVNGETMSHENPNWEQQAYQTGIMTAKLHNFSSSWAEGRLLDRQRYDTSKLISAIKSIEEAVDLDLMDSYHYKIIQNGGVKICELMEELDKISFNSKGLIHADLQRTNLIVHENIVTPIDFCLCGYGYFYMDLGGLLADFSSLSARKALLEGYRGIRELPVSDMKYIEAFFVMVILLCMATHLHNPNMKEWYLRRTKPICNDYIIPFINNKRFYENI